MILHLDSKLWKDWRVILTLFMLLVAALLSEPAENIEDAKKDYSDLDQNTVVRVIDGDTIELASGEKVRYIGIDTPESVDPRKPVECFAKQASQKNEDLVLNKVVRLERDISDKDRYGRLLRYVYVDDKFINLNLVSQGYAHSVSFPPDIKNQELFDKAEQMARDRGEGLWSACQN